MKHGKKYVESAKLIDRASFYETEEAVALVKKSATAKFDETVEYTSEQVVTDVMLNSRSVAL